MVPKSMIWHAFYINVNAHPPILKALFQRLPFVEVQSEQLHSVRVCKVVWASRSRVKSFKKVSDC